MSSKRILDLCLTIPGVIIISPILLLIALSIKLDSRGPVLFRQERIGLLGKAFRIYKFRTMVDGAETMGKYFTIANDQRITRIGRFLRKTKLDELPQLINVLKGEMSLVGPRPQVAKHVSHYPQNIRDIVLSVKPGITGIASVTFVNEERLLSSTDDPDRTYSEIILPKKLAIYLYYVLNHNLWLDFKIILLTVIRLMGIDTSGWIRTNIDPILHKEVAASIENGNPLQNKLTESDLKVV